MIKKLRSLLRSLSETEEVAADPDRVPLAMAALLIEAARADHNVKESELEELGVQLATRLGIESGHAAELIQSARDAVEKSVSLYEFTRPLHETLGYSQKQNFVRMLWSVALADQRLDKYEDYLIGKVSELLYVARGDVIRLRNEVLQEKPSQLGGD